MNLRKDYPYDEALDDLEKFINRHVHHENVRREFFEILNESRYRRTVPMRGIHEKFIKYTKKYELYSPYTDDEKEMIDDLIHFWS